LVLLCARPARADEHPRKLWIEARPWTCSEHIAPFARELSLACDAADGACVVAGDEASADRRLVLKCGEPRWTLEAHDPSGARLWSAELAGGDSDRVRDGAAFVVRAETTAPLPPRVAPPPSSPMLPVRSTDADARSDERRLYGNTFTLAAAPRALLSLADFTRAARANDLVGIGAYAAVRFVYGLRLGATAGVDGGEGGNVGWNLGLLAGLGAPFDSTRFGLLLQTGYFETFNLARGREKTFRENLYLRGSFVCQFLSNSNSTSRMWVGLSPMVAARNEPRLFLGFDIGGAWDPT
jgi:hypothetical protein